MEVQEWACSALGTHGAKAGPGAPPAGSSHSGGGAEGPGNFPPPPPPVPALALSSLVRGLK